MGPGALEQRIVLLVLAAATTAGLGLSLATVGRLLFFDQHLGAKGAVADADGGLGDAQLGEALLGHVLGEALVVPDVSHAAGLDADDGVLAAEANDVPQQADGDALQILLLGLGHGARVPDLLLLLGLEQRE